MENLQKHIMCMFLRFISMSNAYNEINSTYNYYDSFVRSFVFLIIL